MALAAVGTLVLDLNIELGVAAGVPYVLAVLLTLWIPDRRDPIVVAIATTVLMTVGYVLSPAAEAGESWKAMLNRVLAGMAIWITAIAVREKQRLDAEIAAERRRYARAREGLVKQAALAQIGQMAAGVAHEVRNPLTGISGALRIVARRMDPDAEEQSVLRDIQKRLDALAHSITALLAYAQPRKPRREPASLRRVVEDSIALLRKDPLAAGLDVRVRGPEELFRFDPALIGDAVLNLLLNAAQATGGLGRVAVELGRDGPHHVLTITDDGPGIPEPMRDQIFQPFFTTRDGGTGLGLAMARSNVALHDGQLTVSFPEEGGTRFRMVLPGSDASDIWPIGPFAGELGDGIPAKPDGVR